MLPLPGPLSLLLVAPVVLAAVSAGLVALRRASTRRQHLPEEWAFAGAWVFLVGGLVWLETALRGGTLLGFAAPWTWLAAAHFGAAGFGALTVTATACRVVSKPGPRRVLRSLLVLHPLAYLTIAAGISGYPGCDEVGATLYASLFVVQLAAFLLGAPDRVPRGPRMVLGVALAVPVVTVVPALAWAWGMPLFDLPDMVRYHGVVNAVGHVGLGLAALVWGRPLPHDTPASPDPMEGRLPFFSFHLAETQVARAADAQVAPPTAGTVPGLLHAECMWVMELGSPILSSERFQVHRLAVFAAWEDEASLEAFLSATPLGRTLSEGWHVRLAFLRRWGHVAALPDLPESTEAVDPAMPVVAVTLARLKITEAPRFISWGRPVEELVRDHPGTTLALAATRAPNIVCTFSVWRTLQDMRDMVTGRGPTEGIRRHADAMKERVRRGFHHEFTTLRFRALSEHGAWKGQRGFVPTESQ